MVEHLPGVPRALEAQPSALHIKIYLFQEHICFDTTVIHSISTFTVQGFLLSKTLACTNMVCSQTCLCTVLYSLCIY